MAPANSSNFSVNVVLPASGCEIIANVRRCSTCSAKTSFVVLLMKPSRGLPFQTQKPRPRPMEKGRILRACLERVHNASSELAVCRNALVAPRPGLFDFHKYDEYTERPA